MTFSHQEKYEHWVSDYCLTDNAQAFSDHQQAAPLLVEFLLSASKSCNDDINEVTQSQLKDALLNTADRYQLSDSLAKNLPDICASLLDHLEQSGRLSDGTSKGRYLKSFRNTLKQPKTITRPGSKVNRNDPCPCGSGKKYKKCCLNLL